MKLRTSFFFLLIVLWSVLTLTVTTSDAQDSTRWSLPAGAKARFGKGRANEVAYSPDGTRLAVASSIGIWIYDAQSGQELDLFTGHTDSVESVAFSPDGQTLASGSEDATVRLWDVATGNHRTLEGHTDDVHSIPFSPDGQTLASGSIELRSLASSLRNDALSNQHV